MGALPAGSQPPEEGISVRRDTAGKEDTFQIHQLLLVRRLCVWVCVCVCVCVCEEVSSGPLEASMCVPSPLPV